MAAVTGEQFNVFSILGVEADEVRTHSAFLADLLNPKGSHRQGDAFLKLFLGLDAIKNSDSGEYKDSGTFRVRKEASTSQGQIDILLENKEENKEACIVIENKIYAGDQDRQMERYYQYATSEGFKEKQIKLVYLTLDGSPPSTESLGNLPEDSVKCLSYSEDIINWLEECMKLQEVQRVSPIREIVFQYRDLLKQLTGQFTNKGLSMELKNILTENKNYELVPALEEMILAFKVHLQYEFWQELKKKICPLIEVKSSYKTPLKDQIQHFHSVGVRDRWVYQNFHLKSANWNSYDVGLQIGVYRDNNMFFGFILFKNGEQVNCCEDEKFDALVEILGNEFKREEIWLRRHADRLGRKPSKLGLKFPFIEPNPKTEQLLDDSEREKLVQQFADEIAEVVNRLKKNLNQS